jgi:DNA invertase Pin-like site-specific DNA recombinase
LSAIGYVRVSTEEQAREGVSIDAQLESIDAYARMRGLVLSEVFQDPGVSAGKPLSSRPAGARLLEATRRTKGRPAAVIAWRLDRLFRSAVDALRSVEAWDKAGVALHLVTLGGTSIDTGTATGKLLLTLLAGMAEHERMVTSERTREALSHLREKGSRISRYPPYGFRFEDGRLEPIPEEQGIIAQIVDLRNQGYSYDRIVDRLNGVHGRGVPPRGSRWHVSTVRRILARWGGPGGQEKAEA